ncbi:MAG: metalloprotease TldD [Mariprofundaceae bacterium]|nr:metalloprotease TldD [Mariprofundaceae bacterium]
MNLPIAEESLNSMLERMLPANVDDADIYIERTESEGISLEEGMVKHVSASTDQGIGARVIMGEASGHACSDSFEDDALMQVADAARTISTHQTQAPVAPIKIDAAKHQLYQSSSPVIGVSLLARRQLLEEIDSLARSLDPRITQVFASINNGFKEVHILRLDGALLHDKRPMVSFSISVIVEQGDKKETGSAGGGGRFSLTELFQSGEAQRLTREAVRLALLNLDAIDSPAGSMPIVLGSGWPGVLLHEAIGHGLEGDFNRKGSSAFSDKMGQRIASKGVNVVDDGTISKRRGSLNMDDEGTPTQCTPLIEDGILVGYMQDKLNARLMGGQSTGNGRRESYASPVLPRMTNTFMLAGQDDPQDIISSLERGIYAVNFSGGQVDITSGKFVFTTSEAYLVEKGKIIAPLKNATLIGNGPDVLQRVSMIGNDLKLDPGVGTCGKEGQSVPVGVGLPTLRVDEMIVGGTQA